jgi:hypothetical protein
MIRIRLPANEHAIVPLSAERRAVFAANTAFALDRALEEPDRPFPVTPDTPEAHAGIIRAGCAACRGACCTKGGDTAYLYPDHFRRLLPKWKGRTRDGILADYLSRLPGRVYEESCVYHTETGCALPRELRSNLCNTFLCGGLEDMIAAAAKERGPLMIRVDCIREGSSEVVRSATFDATGRSQNRPSLL